MGFEFYGPFKDEKTAKDIGRTMFDVVKLESVYRFEYQHDDYKGLCRFVGTQRDFEEYMKRHDDGFAYPLTQGD